ncbi:MAG: DUF4386 domain-containing protein [Dehalococcoidales bacterium]|nr:DUF4386 domain-containing protein [Dehalococcoidales bacterium]
MNTYRKTAIIVGILFIIGTVSGILSGVVTARIMASAIYPLNISASQPQWIFGTLLILLMGYPLAMIPIMLYPIFKRHNEVLAFGAVLFRGVLEAVLYTASALSMLLLLNVSEISGKTVVTDASNLQTLGTMLIGSGDWISMVLSVVFSVGTLMISTLFFQTKLVPRWLSAWGFIGAVLYFIANLANMFSLQHLALSFSGTGLLMVPLAIQEMVLAVWLIVRGFSPSAISSLSLKTLDYPK